jgi:hypothetical protein
MHRVVRFGAMFRYPRGCRGPARRSAAPGGAHGVHTLRSVAPARGASDRSPVLLSHLPFPGSSAPIISSGDQLCIHEALCADFASPTLLRRQPIKDVPPRLLGFDPRGQSVPRVSSERVPAVTALGFASLRCSVRHVGAARGDSKITAGRQPPEVRFRFLSAHGFSVARRTEMVDGQAVTHSISHRPALQRIEAADA